MSDKIEGRVISLNGKLALGHNVNHEGHTDVQFIELEKYFQDKYFGKYIDVVIKEIL
jgi:hypothetical protein